MNLARYGSIAMAAALSWPTLARAQSPDRETCARAHLSGQELRQATEPLAARDQFFVCASETCPAIIQQDCGRWLEEVQAGLPTVVLGARTASGQDIVDARVTANGREIAKRLDGKPVALDPGQQTFVFTIAGHGEIRVDALVKAGAKNREIIAELPPSDKADGAPSGSEPPLAFWVLAGVGTAGLASFGIFAALGESEYQDGFRRHQVPRRGHLLGRCPRGIRWGRVLLLHSVAPRVGRDARAALGSSIDRCAHRVRRIHRAPRRALSACYTER
jgi:hypothetical protein